VNVFGGPRRIWWAGAWVSLAAPAVIPGVWDGGIQYEPRGYVALAKPVCSGVTPEGYRLTWRDVPTDTGVVIPQCVAYYPRGRAAPAVAVGAVPGQTVCAAAQFGETGHGWLGVRIQQVTDELADSLNISPPRGALVAVVDDRGPAKPAGIEPGDVIVKFDGKDIKEMRDLPRLVADTPVGKQTPVVIIRRGEEETKTVTLGRLEDGEKLAAADPKCEGTPEPVGSAMAQGCLVEIYSQVAFTGTSSDVAADQPRLSEYGWDKQISSLNVKSGTWDFYSEPDYGGPVVRLPPGQYANLEGWGQADQLIHVHPGRMSGNPDALVFFLGNWGGDRARRIACRRAEKCLLSRGQGDRERGVQA